MPVVLSPGVQTIGAASQPVFGTTLSAASTLMPDMFSGGTGPASQPSISKLTLTSVKGFIPGLRIAVAPKNHFIAPPGGYQDCGTILSIAGSVLTVQGLTAAHPSGDYVVICEVAADVEIIPVVTSGPIYVGTYSTVSATDSSVFDVIPQLAGDLTYWHQSRSGVGANQYGTNEFWVFGTQNDTFVARFSQS